MALLNDIYIFVKTESTASNIEVSTHPVEKGIDITDNVRKKPLTLSLTGEIVGAESPSIRAKIESLHTKGKPVRYLGRRLLKLAQITAFTASYSNQVTGGFEFTMDLSEVRTAKTPYKDKKTGKKTKDGTKQVKENKKGKVYHTVKKGETASSIAKKYKSKGCTLAFITKNNPNAPKVKGNWKTLQIGAKLWVYSK